MAARTRSIGFWLILVAVLLALPHIVQSSQQREILVFLVINALIVASYRLLTLTGEWSLAHVVLVGVGAYGTAILSKDLGFPPPVAVLCGAAIAAFVAWTLSFPLFRMKGFYFLIGSFAAGEAIRLSWRLSSLRDVFGGPKGLKSIPTFGKVEVFGTTIDFWNATAFYYLALVVVSVCLFLLWRVERSRIGMLFHALHWQDKLAESVGVDARGYRTLALVVASGFAGVAGGLYAHYIGTVSPNAFDVSQMVDVLIWVIVGGTATFYGPLLGLFVLTVLNELVLRELGVDLARPLIYGGLLILAILFLPNGLESLVEKARARISGRKSGSEEDRTISAS